MTKAEYLRPFAVHGIILYTYTHACIMYPPLPNLLNQTDAARRSGVYRTLKNWVTHISGMERDFRNAKKLWTGAGEEPDGSLHGDGAWQT